MKLPIALAAGPTGSVQKTGKPPPSAVRPLWLPRRPRMFALFHLLKALRTASPLLEKPFPEKSQFGPSKCQWVVGFPHAP